MATGVIEAVLTELNVFVASEPDVIFAAVIALAPVEGLAEALGETDGDFEAEGLTEEEGLVEAEGEMLGDLLVLGETDGEIEDITVIAVALLSRSDLGDCRYRNSKSGLKACWVYCVHTY